VASSHFHDDVSINFSPQVSRKNRCLKKNAPLMQLCNNRSSPGVRTPLPAAKRKFPYRAYLAEIPAAGLD
jgi:hypothetical protein